MYSIKAGDLNTHFDILYLQLNLVFLTVSSIVFFGMQKVFLNFYFLTNEMLLFMNLICSDFGSVNAAAFHPILMLLLLFLFSVLLFTVLTSTHAFHILQPFISPEDFICLYKKLCIIIYRVSSYLENLEMSRNFNARRRSQGRVKEFCCVKFIFSQSEHLNSEHFLRENAPDHPKQSLTYIRI